jgi:tRNA (cytidine/uridine-2'-O-)-methyltransferase
MDSQGRTIVLRCVVGGLKTMLHVAIYHPEIPQNTGAIIRLCANTGAALHLIEPMGFPWEDAKLRRAGLDYHEYATVTRHANWEAFLETIGGMESRRIFAFTARGATLLPEIAFADEDVLLFGPESTGLSDDMLALFPTERRVRLPMRPNNRSLNLSNAVAVSVFEAWRQLGYIGGA